MNDDLQQLARLACEARQQAYAPYSKFRVGAALVTADGSIFTGCNIENASYGLTICAERVAVFTAIASGQSALVALVVATDTSEPVPPCGACRQVLHEFAPRLRITSVGGTGQSATWTLDELLPSAFNLEPPEVTG